MSRILSLQRVLLWASQQFALLRARHQTESMHANHQPVLQRALSVMLAPLRLGVFAVLAIGLASQANSAASSLPSAVVASGGELNAKIIGGVEVSNGDPVAQTTVLINGKMNRGSFTCTGVIYSDELVLTAGHCLGTYRNAELTVYFRLKKSGMGPILKARAVTRIRETLPGTPTDWDDLAMIRLESKIPAGYRPAKILQESYVLQAAEDILLAGYGINVPQMPSNGDGGLGVLRKVSQKILIPSYGRSEVLVDIHERGSCSGDSGGPAFKQIGDDLFVFGLASRLTERDKVPGSGGRGGPDYTCTVDLVYTNLQGYGSWLKSAEEELMRAK